ncbi:LuxR C-terminal-related transcriptional regulator [Kribbella sp. NPDC048915]|uniref:helix-turn-helix transcriptional regulator n=1 Tax=Kribbella sp. NPDC048915 TaxID=3155148 RepID=UPI0033FBE21D
MGGSRRVEWPGSGGANAADEAWLTAIAQAAAGGSAEAPLELLVEYLSLLADAAISGRRPKEHEIAIVRELGRRAAEQGIPVGRVVDLYLSAASRMWRDLPDVVPYRDRDTVRASAQSVLRAVGEAIAVLVDSYQAAVAAAGGDEDAVREACEVGVMVREPKHGAFARHPVLAEVAYETLLAQNRRQVHGRLAANLAAVLPERPTAAEIAEIAEQYRRAEDTEQALVWSVRAARVAERGYAIAEAGHWYAVAASLWAPETQAGTQADIPERLSLLVSAATHLASVGETTRAMELLRGDLTTLSETPDQVLAAALTRGWLGTAVGDTAQALSDIELAHRLVPADDPVTLARICASEAMALGTCSRWDEAEVPARTALELGARYADIRTVGKAHFLLGVRANLRGQVAEAVDHHQRALVIAHAVAEPEDLAMAGVGLTDLYLRLGNPDRAARVASFVGSRVRRLMLGRHWLEDIMDGNVVQALYESGRWDEAVAWLGEPSEPSELSELGFFQVMVVPVHLARGDVATAEHLLQQAASLSERDQPQFVGPYGEARARLLVQTGRAQEALDLALSVAGTARATDDEDVEVGLLLAGLEAAAAANAPDGLEQLVSDLGGPPTGRTRAAVAAVIDGERARARGSFDPRPWLRAAHEWFALGRPYDEARARFRAAEAILASRRGVMARRSAAQQLVAACRLAQRLRAGPLLHEIDRVARLGRIDAERPDNAHAEHSRAPAGPKALTEREQQVLALLAAGLTNREIGRALYMSPKTASVHVTHILGKLGVRSRVQAAAVAGRLRLDRGGDARAR